MDKEFQEFIKLLVPALAKNKIVVKEKCKKCGNGLVYGKELPDGSIRYLKDETKYMSGIQGRNDITTCENCRQVNYDHYWKMDQEEKEAKLKNHEIEREQNNCPPGHVYSQHMGKKKGKGKDGPDLWR